MVKNPHANAGDAGDVALISGEERSPGDGNGNSPQYSLLEIPCAEEPGRLSPWGHRVRHN